MAFDGDGEMNGRRCPWHGQIDEHESEGQQCWLNRVDAYTLSHTYALTQYSVDPTTGRPMIHVLGTHGITANDFVMNQRLCAVSCELPNTQSLTHLLAYEPRSAADMWSLIREVILHWTAPEDDLAEVWPSTSSVVDAVYDPSNDTMTPLRPVRFTRTSQPFTRALYRITSRLFYNYVMRRIRMAVSVSRSTAAGGGGDDGESYETSNVHSLGELNHITDELLQISGNGVPADHAKVRLLECNYRSYYLGYLYRYDNDAYHKSVGQTVASDHHHSHAAAASIFVDDEAVCCLKKTFDSICYAVKNVSVPTVRRMFHTLCAETFGDHRDYPHLILCKRFVIDSRKTYCRWLRLFESYVEHRLLKLNALALTELVADESSRTNMRMLMADWRRSFKTLEELERSTRREADKAASQAKRIKKRNRTIEDLYEEKY